MTYQALGSLTVILLFSACSAAPESGSKHTTNAPGTGGTGPLGAGGSASSLGLGGETGDSSEPCNGFDDDGDGLVDEGCPCTPGTTQVCHPYAPGTIEGVVCEPGVQSCAATGELGSWGECEGGVGPTPEICGNGFDENCDGSDEPCGGTGGTGGSGGTPGCVPTAEICGNGLDEDCDGQDAPCTDVVCQNISLFGDCLTVSCPASAPYPQSCNVFFTPGDDRGCVANAPNSSVVYFQAGDQCNAGFVTGELCCAKTPQPPLTQQNCPINKPTQFHVSDPNQCPATTN